MSKERYVVGMSMTEEGKELYVVVDSFFPLATQYLRYFSARKRAEAECKRLNVEYRKEQS